MSADSLVLRDENFNHDGHRNTLRMDPKGGGHPSARISVRISVTAEITHTAVIATSIDLDSFAAHGLLDQLKEILE